MDIAEWEDGIPPESRKAMMSHTPFLYLFVKICEETSLVQILAVKIRQEKILKNC